MYEGGNVVNIVEYCAYDMSIELVDMMIILNDTGTSTKHEEYNAETSNLGEWVQKYHRIVSSYIRNRSHYYRIEECDLEDDWIEYIYAVRVGGTELVFSIFYEGDEVVVENKHFTKTTKTFYEVDE